MSSLQVVEFIGVGTRIDTQVFSSLESTLLLR